MVMAILRRNVSEKRAFELLTLGAEIDAHEAERIGLANKVFGDETFDSDVAAYTRSFVRSNQSATLLAKQLLYQIDGLTFADAIEAGRRCQRYRPPD